MFFGGEKWEISIQQHAKICLMSKEFSLAHIEQAVLANQQAGRSKNRQSGR